MNSREISRIFGGFHISFIPLSPCEKPRCFASTHGDPRGHAGQHHLGSNATGSGTARSGEVEVDDVWLIFIVDDYSSYPYFCWLFFCCC